MDVRPLSDIVNQLQEIGKSKHGDSLFTGHEFVEEYGNPGQPIDEEPNQTIATAGGDVQTAYSKLYSIYMRSKNETDHSTNQYKLNSKHEGTSLNIQATIHDMEIAIERLQTAATKLQENNVDLHNTLTDLAQHISAHKKQIENTHIITLR